MIPCLLSVPDLITRQGVQLSSLARATGHLGTRLPISCFPSAVHPGQLRMAVKDWLSYLRYPEPGTTRIGWLVSVPESLLHFREKHDGCSIWAERECK